MSAYLDRERKKILISGYAVTETGEKYNGNHLGGILFLKIILR